MTELEMKVIKLMDSYTLPPFSNIAGELYAICKNISKCCGDYPTDEQIENEVEIFYNNHEDMAYKF